jgi:hypothetical protein
MLSKFLKNKKIIIVGPSASSLINKNGNFFDSFDIVIRVNRGVEPTKLYPEFIGKRTDILYNCMLEKPDNGGIIDVELLKNNNVKYVIYHPDVSFEGICVNRPPKTLNMNTINKLHSNNINTQMIDSNFYNSISKQVNCRPNTGFIALFHLLSFDIKELYITGYTFYLDGFMNGYKDHVDKEQFRDKCFKSKRHNQKNLWKFLKEQKQKDSRIKTDKYLERILNLDNLNNDEETIKYVFN